MSELGASTASTAVTLAQEMFYGIYTYNGSSAGTLWDMQVYIATATGYSATLEGAVYQVGTGNEIGQTPPQAISTNGNFEWETLDMNSPGTLLSGSSYYLCLDIVSETSGTVTFGTDSVTSTNFYKYPSFSGFTSTFTGGGTGVTGEPSLFVDYCP